MARACGGNRVSPVALGHAGSRLPELSWTTQGKQRRGCPFASLVDTPTRLKPTPGSGDTIEHWSPRAGLRRASFKSGAGPSRDVNVEFGHSIAVTRLLISVRDRSGAQRPLSRHGIDRPAFLVIVRTLTSRDVNVEFGHSIAVTRLLISVRDRSGAQRPLSRHGIDRPAFLVIVRTLTSVRRNCFDSGW
jgi:hypothetical protein